ncbi:MAG: alcohol dehydrogenase [Chloroflexi bacterium HGW-Chloroflexi-10]|nr:MAG: alcohol dehydrogenase [Chloroflexi bacterium HGW-Chloroflexi-10]
MVKGLRLYDIGDLRFTQEPEPQPRPGEALLKVDAVGICGSDVHWVAEGGTGTATLIKPLILGHEFAATVLVGKFAGQRVAVEPMIPCGMCEFCREGNPNLCPNHRFAGQSPEDGALQERLAWPEENLFVLPEKLSAVDGAMLEPLGVAIHSVDLGKLRIGNIVGVFGCGPIGLLVVQLARLAGAARIFATDRLPHRLEMARAMGATDVLKAENAGEAELILKATSGRGLDVTFEMAGDAFALTTAVETCKPGGRLVLCGIPADDTLTLGAAVTRRKGLTVKMVRRMKHTYPRAIDLVTSGKVDVRSMVTHVFPFEQGMEALAVAQRREGGKVVVVL